MGYCKSHASRVRRYGYPGEADFRLRKIENPAEEPDPAMRCKVDDCLRRIWAKGYCPTHYRRWSRYGDPLELRMVLPAVPKKCSRKGCDNLRTTKGLCNIHYLKRYQAQNPVEPGSRRQATRRHILSGYGLTIEDYDAMVAAQDGRCAICQSPHAGNNGHPNYSWCVDHDHRTGAVRGLLCNRCNSAIGLFDDDQAILAAALDYLRQHESRERTAS